jgi:hypothetical protein
MSIAERKARKWAAKRSAAAIDKRLVSCAILTVSSANECCGPEQGKTNGLSNESCRPEQGKTNGSKWKGGVKPRLSFCLLNRRTA